MIQYGSSWSEAIHLGDCTSAWYTSVYCFRSRSTFYFQVLGGLIRSTEDGITIQHCLPPLDRWLVRENYSTLEDMLSACVLEVKNSWDKHVLLIGFAYNNSYHFSIYISPYEVHYDRNGRSLLCWYEACERRLNRSTIVEDTFEAIQIIRERLHIV